MSNSKEENIVAKTIFSIVEAAEFVGVSSCILYNYWRDGKLPAIDGGGKPVRFHIPDLVTLRDKLSPGCMDRFWNFQECTRLSDNVLVIALDLIDPSIISHWRCGRRQPFGSMMQKMNRLTSFSIDSALRRILKAVEGMHPSHTKHGDKDAMLQLVERAISRNQYDRYGVGSAESKPKPNPKFACKKGKLGSKLVRCKSENKHISNMLPKEMCENIEHWMRVNGSSYTLTARLMGCSDSALRQWLMQGNISMPSLEKVEKFCRDKGIEMTGHLVTSRLTFMPEKKVEPEDDGKKEIHLSAKDFDEDDDMDEEDDIDMEEQEEQEDTLEYLMTKFTR
ncbi:hypothetical protein LCGC14_2171730, partial [marine sediment metagenome]